MKTKKRNNIENDTIKYKNGSTIQFATCNNSSDTYESWKKDPNKFKKVNLLNKDFGNRKFKLNFPLIFIIKYVIAITEN